MYQKILTYTTLPSTNSEAARMILKGQVSHPIYLVTDYQESGKGQGDNSWQSDAGKNLLLSWIVFPAFLSVHRQFQLSKAVSLAICDLLRFHNIEYKIKWPNDILCRKMKIGGILIENSVLGSTLQYSIIGIGLNVNQTNFPEFPYQATSMYNTSGKKYAISEIRDQLITNLEYRYSQLKDGQYHKTDSAYLNSLFCLNEECIFTAGNENFKAIIRGVNEIGELILEKNNKALCYGYHSIKMHF